jgi:hypothetical protein
MTREEIDKTIDALIALFVRRGAHRPQLAALEQKLDELEKKRIELFQQYSIARKEQEQSKSRDALLKDLQDALRAVDEAIDNNPQIVAEKQEMARLNQENREIGVQRGKLFEAVRASQKAYDTAVQTNLVAIWQQAQQERIQALGDRKDWSHLTPDESPKLQEIQSKYASLSHATAVEYGERKASKKLDPEDQKKMDEIHNLMAKIEANTSQYAKISDGMSLERARVMREDPRIMALCNVVDEKRDRLAASVQAAPELAEYKTKFRELKNQMVETSRLLGQLKRQAIGTSAAGTSPDKTGKNS